MPVHPTGAMLLWSQEGGGRVDWLYPKQLRYSSISHVCLPADVNVLIYVVPLVVAFFIIAVVLAIYCKTKAWIMKPVPLPGPLVTFFVFYNFRFKRQPLSLARLC